MGLEYLFDIRFALVSALGIFGPVFFIVVAIEFFYFKKRGEEGRVFNLQDTVTSIVLTMMYQFGEIVFGLLLAPLYIFLYDIRIFTIPNNWWELFLLFIAQDFLYYWFHRFSHEARIMWASHSTHHSSTFMNFTVAFRQSLTYNFSGMFVFWLPLPVLGFDPVAVLWMVGLSLSYQFFVHTEMVYKLGWFELFFNTPSHHRVHHNRDPLRMNSNYGGILIIWDRLFGTFVEEQKDMVHDYGTPELIKSTNPWAITFIKWNKIFNDFLKRKSVVQKIKSFFERPEHKYINN